MTDPRPLWEVMYHSFWKCPKENWHLSCAYMIRAVADWLVPEELEPEEPVGYGISADCGEFIDQWARWHDRQRLRALLTAEADRAERGETINSSENN